MRTLSDRHRPLAQLHQMVDFMVLQPPRRGLWGCGGPSGPRTQAEALAGRPRRLAGYSALADHPLPDCSHAKRASTPGLWPHAVHQPRPFRHAKRASGDGSCPHGSASTHGLSHGTRASGTVSYPHTSLPVLAQPACALQGVRPNGVCINRWPPARAPRPHTSLPVLAQPACALQGVRPTGRASTPGLWPHASLRPNGVCINRRPFPHAKRASALTELSPRPACPAPYWCAPEGCVHQPLAAPHPPCASKPAAPNATRSSSHEFQALATPDPMGAGRATASAAIAALESTQQGGGRVRVSWHPYESTRAGDACPDLKGQRR